MNRHKLLLPLIIATLFSVTEMYSQSRKKRLSKRQKSKIEARFSFLVQAEYIKSQIDGDFLKGYDKSGYMFGGGVQYRLTNEFSLMADVSFNSIGSMRSDPFLTKLRYGVQLDFEMKTIAPGISLVINPIGKKYTIETGLNYHRLINYDYSSNFRTTTTAEVELSDEYIGSGFLAVQFKVGYTFVKNLRFYGKYNHGISSLLKKDYINIHKIQPYWISFGVYYLINA